MQNKNMAAPFLRLWYSPPVATRLTCHRLREWPPGKVVVVLLQHCSPTCVWDIVSPPPSLWLQCLQHPHALFSHHFPPARACQLACTSHVSACTCCTVTTPHVSACTCMLYVHAICTWTTCTSELRESRSDCVLLNAMTSAPKRASALTVARPIPVCQYGMWWT